MSKYTIEYELESDGRWIAEVPQLPGVLAYGSTQKEAKANADALLFHMNADKKIL